jgi:hypothetical protein
MEIERTVDLLGLTSQGSRAGVAKSISEAVRNVFEHANAADGAFLCASYFQAADRLSIAVADAGIGVPATIRPRYGSKLSDAEANLLATELKVTGARPSPRYGGAISNAGVGLYYLRTVSFRSKGLFALLSGTAAVRDGGNGLPPTTAPSRAAWKGTVVAVTLSASRADEIMNTTHEIFARGLSGDRKRQIIGFGHPPPGAELITITPTVVGLIEDKAQARRLRDTVILPAIKAGQPSESTFVLVNSLHIRSRMLCCSQPYGKRALMRSACCSSVHRRIRSGTLCGWFLGTLQMNLMNLWPKSWRMRSME